MDILPIIFTFSGGNIAPEYHDFRQIPVYHTLILSDIKGVQMKIDFGSAIRSYVFMPYQLVKDQRTEYENGNIQNVMDGDLDGFINAYLSMKAAD